MRARSLPPPAHVLQGCYVIVSAETAAWISEHSNLPAAYGARAFEADRAVASELAALLGIAASSDLSTERGTSVAAEHPDDAPLTSESWMSPRKAGGVIGISDRAVRRAATEQRIKAIRSGRDWLIDADDVERYRAERRRPA